MNFGAHSHTLVFLYLILWATLAFAQGTKIHSGPLAGLNNDQARKRELWFRHGRAVPGQPAARLRVRKRRHERPAEYCDYRRQRSHGPSRKTGSAVVRRGILAGRGGVGFRQTERAPSHDEKADSAGNPGHTTRRVRCL